MSQQDSSDMLDRLFELRYGDIPTCPACNGQGSFYRLNSRPAYSCQWCSHQIFPAKGTIFQKSVTPLKTWKYIYDRFNEGESLKQSERETGLTYKSVWRISHLTRSLKPNTVEYKLLN